MCAKRAKLDTLFQSHNVEVEPEELVEPESEAQDEMQIAEMPTCLPEEAAEEPKAKGKPTRMAAIRERLSRYGNRALGSAKKFFITFWNMLINIGTAIAGSIVLLPFVILVRGLDVLLSTIFSLAKSAVLSVFRVIFDVLCIPVRALNELFHGFNKRVLYPLVKQIKEDDTTALVAFGALIVIVACVVFIATRLGH